MHKKRSKSQCSSLQKAKKAKAARARTAAFRKNTVACTNSLTEAAKNTGASSEVLNRFQDTSLCPIDDRGLVYIPRIIKLAAEAIGLNNVLKDPLHSTKNGVRTLYDRVMAAIMAKICYQSLNDAAKDNNFTSAIGTSKSDLYRTMTNQQIPWKKATIHCALNLANLVFENSRNLVVIVDDCLYARSFAENCEGMARIFDHVSKSYVKGYQLLTIVLSDGEITVPVILELSSSCDKPSGPDAEEDVKNQRLVEFPETEHGTECDELVEDMRALNKMERTVSSLKLLMNELNENHPSLRKKVKFFACDSWFTSSFSLQEEVKAHGLSFVGALKQNHVKFITHDDDKSTSLRTVKELCDENAKEAAALNKFSKKYTVSRPNSSLKQSIVVASNYSHGSKKPCIAILANSLALSCAQILKKYGTRVSVEQMYRVFKTAFDLEPSCIACKLSHIYAHIHVLALVYLLSVACIFLEKLNITLYSFKATVLKIFEKGVDFVKNIMIFIKNQSKYPCYDNDRALCDFVLDLSLKYT